MKIALTFDIERDNPNFLDTYFGIKVGLLKIIRILDNFNIKGTFFCTGNVVKRLPEYIRLIESKEHEIACHGLNHERLNRLNFKECREIIHQNKELIENICQNSEIIGFRAPYLKAPRFLFKVLESLGFKYDSSIKSPKILKNYQVEGCKIHEFHPSELGTLFRLPLSDSLLRKRIYRKKLVILYFHSWEAVNMKSIVFNQTHGINFVKNFQFRPDRWVNTGNLFISRIISFISESISRKAEFVSLKQLLIEKDNYF